MRLTPSSPVRELGGEYPAYLAQRLAKLSPDAQRYRRAVETFRAQFFFQPTDILVVGLATLHRRDLSDREGDVINVLAADEFDLRSLPTEIEGVTVCVEPAQNLLGSCSERTCARVRALLGEPFLEAPTWLTALILLARFYPQDREDLRTALLRSDSTRLYLGREASLLPPEAPELRDDRIDLLMETGVL